MSKDTAAIRDQLGNDPEIIPILNANYFEEIGVEEGPTLIESKNVGNSWIVGSSTNAIVGDWTGTINGTQLIVGVTLFVLGNPTFGVLGTSILGEDSRVKTILMVVNPNNSFKERFAFDYMLDTTNSTATINTTAQQASFVNEPSEFTMTFPITFA